MSSDAVLEADVRPVHPLQKAEAAALALVLLVVGVEHAIAERGRDVVCPLVTNGGERLAGRAGVAPAANVSFRVDEPFRVDAVLCGEAEASPCAARLKATRGRKGWSA